MPRLRVNTPLWLGRDADSRRIRFPTLTPRSRGGRRRDRRRHHRRRRGVALRRRGRARRGRRGGTQSRAAARSASTALLMQEPDEDFSELTQRYGTARARRIWQLSLDATRDFVATLTASAYRLRPRPSRLASTTRRTAAAARRLRVEHRRRAAAGARRDAGWTARRCARAVGFDAAGAIRTRGNAQADPFKACIGLMRAAARRGRAHLRALAGAPPSGRRRDDVVVRTPRGSIRADRVVIATGYATPYFKPLHARFRMLNTYVIATRPLTPAERRRIGPRRGDDLGYGTAVPLRAMDAGSPADARRRAIVRSCRERRAPRRARRRRARGPRRLRAAVSGAGRYRDRLPLGGTVRDDAGRPAVHRPAPPLSAVSCSRSATAATG